MKKIVMILIMLCLTGSILTGCKDMRLQNTIKVSQAQKAAGGFRVQNIFKDFKPLNILKGAKPHEIFTWFESQEGGFYVMTPGRPNHEIEALNFENAQIELHNYSINKKDIAYAVSYTEYPENVVLYTTTVRILDNARDGAVKNVNGKLIKETEISMDKYPGRELTIEVPGKQGKAYQRIYLAGNRLYQIITVFSKDKEKDYTKDMVKYFDSFKITYNQEKNSVTGTGHL